MKIILSNMITDEKTALISRKPAADVDISSRDRAITMVTPPKNAAPSMSMRKKSQASPKEFCSAPSQYLSKHSACLVQKWPSSPKARTVTPPWRWGRKARQNGRAPRRQAIALTLRTSTKLP